MSRTVPEARATASNSEPSAADGWGATSTTATSTEVMNSTRVCAARELRPRDALIASLLTESATNSRPVSAPATAASASPKLSHAVVVYPTGPPPSPSHRALATISTRFPSGSANIAAGRGRGRVPGGPSARTGDRCHPAAVADLQAKRHATFPPIDRYLRKGLPSARDGAPRSGGAAAPFGFAQGDRRRRALWSARLDFVTHAHGCY